MAKLYASTDATITDREKRNMERSRKIATQGMVLLKNNGVLPLKHTGKIALYGNGARHTIKGGTGSGDVNSRFVVNVEQGLEEAGFEITTKSWLDSYDKVIKEAETLYYEGITAAAKRGEDAFAMLFEQPFKAPAVPAPEPERLKQDTADTAIYVLARNSGEGRDRKPVEGDFLLYKEEEKLLEVLTKHYKHVIVLLNVGGVIDITYLRENDRIEAVLLMSQAGNVGGSAVVDVLTGKETPSGHLTSTWAEKYEDYPSAAAFSHMNGNVDDEYYTEGIYVGYRYFDSFDIASAYPFGYGMSYTTFSVETEEVTVEAEKISISVKVTNTGSTYSGKEVVQVYYSAPRGELEKPYQELIAYAKTKNLAPGENQQLLITFSVRDMASYHEKKAAWLLESGSYYLRVGTHSRATEIAAEILLDKEVITEQLANCLPLDCELETMSLEGAVSYCYEIEAEEKKKAKKITLCADTIPCHKVVYEKELPFYENKIENHKITMDEVKAGSYSLDELVAQLTIEEMAELCVGTARGEGDSDCIIGAASACCPGAAGDTTSRMIADRNIRNMILADGPAGLRLSRTFKADKDKNLIPGTGDAPIPGMEYLTDKKDKPVIPEDAVTYYQYCTAIPIAVMLAQSWDEQVIMEAGDIVGEEMELFGVTLWLAPGMNIHRNPLCGRNFEYYSEDPIVSGNCASAATFGVQKHAGVGTTIKHFAFNNQEDNRLHANEHIGERAIREIYLKGFEIAVKRANPMSIMSSYNLINGIHTANSYDLLTKVARDEWGFSGIIMSDWGTTGNPLNDKQPAYKYGDSNAAGCIKAGNDLIMPGNSNDVKEIIKSVGAEEKTVTYPLTINELQACAKRMLYIIKESTV